MDADDIIFITGAASGIGFATAELCARAGAAVIMADVQEDALEDAAKRLGGRAAPVVLDITDESAVAKALAPYNGKLTGAVNSAGIGADCAALDTEVSSFRKILEINLLGAFIVAREAAKTMRVDGGAIVNITSVSGVRGNVGRAAYGSSKGGAEMLTKIMATELGRRNIRVNSVAPGPVETPMTAQHHTPQMRGGWLKTVPMERYAQPDEVAAAAMFLLDPKQSGYVNGQTLCVDGGFAAAGITPAIANG